MTIEEVYNKMTNCQLRPILDYSYLVGDHRMTIIDDYDSMDFNIKVDSDGKTHISHVVPYIHRGLLYHSNDGLIYDSFDVLEFKAIIREKMINSIIE